MSPPLPPPVSAAQTVSYERLSLVELIERIVGASDHEALTELHENRKCFEFGDDRTELRLASYIDCLRLYGPERENRELSDRAYSLTIDKFTNLPDASTAEKDLSPKRGTGPDCRNYYRAFLVLLRAGIQQQRNPASLAGEATAAWRLQGLVLRHFHLSLRECRRNGDMTRFTWTLDTGEIHLHMPRSLAGPRRRSWLEENVTAPDPRRPGEPARVQAIIDTRLKPAVFNDLVRAERLYDAPAASSTTPWFAPNSIKSKGLAETVAREKAETVAVQRPAIRKLGADKLGELVRQTFAALDTDQCHDTELAAAFGLSKASFSRFAGSRWNGVGGVAAAMSVPDLWINTARVVAREPAFVEAAVDVGVWRTVATVAGVPTNTRSTL